MKIRIIGTGSWGTALAQVLADNHHDVIMYGIAEDEVSDINNNHKNSKFFETDINVNIKASNDFSIVSDADVVLLGVPTIAIEDICKQLYETLEHKVYLINVAKGFHPQTKERLSTFIKQYMNDKLIDVISLIGPSHAEEVILRKTTTVNSVCENIESAKLIQELFANDYFRVYTHTDVVGAEIAAATKNIMAIASGCLEGIGEGDNARAALMTRGLAEMTRFGLTLGAKKETFLGLNGVGDLIVTCTSYHSRNFQAGLIIGQNNEAETFLNQNTKTTEGVNACKVVYELAKELGIEMPITNELYAVLYENKKPTDAIKSLMCRPLKNEEL